MDNNLTGCVDLGTEYPNFIELQKGSYDRLFKLYSSFEERKNEDLYKVFRKFFPITSSNGVYSFDFVDYTILPPRYTIEECLKFEISYSVSLVVKFCIINQEKKTISEMEAYIGDIPYITEKGSFVYNGVERVIVSQMHRISGLAFFHRGSTRGNIEFEYFCRIIPERGVWIEIGLNNKGLLGISFTQRGKVLLSTFFRALGWGSNEDILNKFGLIECVKVNKSIKKYVGRTITSDVKPSKGDDVLIKGGCPIDNDVISILLNNGVEKIYIYIDDCKKVEEYKPLINTLEESPNETDIEASSKIYSLFYKKVNIKTSEEAKKFVRSVISDENEYYLSDFGTCRLKTLIESRKKEKCDCRVLTDDDFVGIVKKLVNIINRKENPDDVDNLNNKYLKNVGDQLHDKVRAFVKKMQVSIQGRINITNTVEDLNVTDLFNAVNFNIVMNSFFATNFSSQFMDEINPLSELVHKRKITSIGVGGIEKTTSSSNLRDIHYSQYGRICPIETPEGITIGLIHSLAIRAKLNYLGQILSPFRVVNNGIIDLSDKGVVFLSADDEIGKNIMQKSSNFDKKGLLGDNLVKVRCDDDVKMVKKEEVDYMDVSSDQPFSISTCLIPFLEHDESTRALMGANMQRQAVPLLQTDAAIVNTGLEKNLVTYFEDIIVAERNGTVIYVDASKIVIRYDLSEEEKLVSYDEEEKEYHITKNKKSNQKTCIDYRPIVNVGQRVKKGDVLVEGFATKNGELALGTNLKVAFMMWKGYNYEDAIIVSERLVKEDILTSVHIEDFEVVIKETKGRREDFTKNIHNDDPSVSNLDDDGLVKVGSKVNEGDVLIGKVVPRVNNSNSSEDALLTALFGDKICDTKDDSLVVPHFYSGTVIKSQLLQKNDMNRLKSTVDAEISELKSKYIKILDDFISIAVKKFTKLLSNHKCNNILNCLGEVVLEKGNKITQNVIQDLILKVDFIESLDCKNTGLSGFVNLGKLNYGNFVLDEKVNRLVEILSVNTLKKQDSIVNDFVKKVLQIRHGDILQDGIYKKAKITIADKKKIQVGDKMSGRHGNKGVVAKILKEEDMPFLADGSPVDIILTPLGLPSRMNIGQLYETLLGWAGEKLGCRYSVPVFEGMSLECINNELEKAGIPAFGEVQLYDGLTGEKFDQKCTVGVMYMLKLDHLVDDKIHSRSVGDYSLITQQPLGGRSQFGGQRFGEMEVWALEAFGAANVLQEMMTIKSDDIYGRSKAYESIIRQNLVQMGKKSEAFSVFIQELRGIVLSVTLK